MGNEQAVDQAIQDGLGSGGGMLDNLLASLGVFAFVGAALGILMIISMWKIFENAGKPGWASLIPVYNIIVFLEIIGKPVWHIIFAILCFPMIVLMFTWNIELAKKFGKGAGFGLGLVFFPFIFMPLLAFGSSSYNK